MFKYAVTAAATLTCCALVDWLLVQTPAPHSGGPALSPAVADGNAVIDPSLAPQRNSHDNHEEQNGPLAPRSVSEQSMALLSEQLCTEDGVLDEPRVAALGFTPEEVAAISRFLAARWPAMVALQAEKPVLAADSKSLKLPALAVTAIETLFKPANGTDDWSRSNTGSLVHAALFERACRVFGFPVKITKGEMAFTSFSYRVVGAEPTTTYCIERPRISNMMISAGQAAGHPYESLFHLLK